VAPLPQVAPAVETEPVLAYGPAQASALAWAYQRSANFVREASREEMLGQGRLASDRIVMKREVQPALAAAQVV